MICNRCGMQNNDGSKFCMSCGNNLEVITIQKENNGVINQTLENNVIKQSVNTDINFNNNSFMNLNNTTGISNHLIDNTIESQNIPNNNNQNSKKEKKTISKKLIFIIIGVLIVLILAIILLSKIFVGKENKYIEKVTNSSFEETNGHYVLKDENGKILLDNISRHGGFCNGTTVVRNTNDEYAITDGSGKLIVEYGKYDYISQYSTWGGKYSCFYEVTDKSVGYQNHILKYDGSILYSNKDDLFLDDVDLDVFDHSTRFVLFKTKKNYQFLNYLGNPFLTLENNTGYEEPSVLNNQGKKANEVYLNIFYAGKTYIYDLNTFKLAFDVFDGQYWVTSRITSSETVSVAGIPANTHDSEQLIIFGYPNPDNTETGKTYIVENGKILFETDKCKRARFCNGGENFECLIKGEAPWEQVWDVYDKKGNKIKTNDNS